LALDDAEAFTLQGFNPYLIDARLDRRFNLAGDPPFKLLKQPILSVISCPADHLRYQTLSYWNQTLFCRNYLSGHDMNGQGEQAVEELGHGRKFLPLLPFLSRQGQSRICLEFFQGAAGEVSGADGVEQLPQGGSGIDRLQIVLRASVI
jgi:hypothetical protein